MTRTLRYSTAGIVLLGVVAAGCANDATSTRERGGHFELVQPVPARALPGYPLYDSIKVRLVDRDGDVMRHTPVQWLAQDGSVSGQAETDGDGVAAAEWTLGSTEGVQSLRVTTVQDSSLTVETEARYFIADRVSARYAGGCALRSGDLWCWGTAGAEDPVGRKSVSRVVVGGESSAYTRPVRVTQGESFVDLRMTDQMICGLRATGAVGCLPGAWPGDSLPTVQAVTVPPLRVIAGAPTSSGMMCGLLVSDSTPWCWNQTRQATKVASAPPLLDLGGIAGFSALAMGGCGRQVDLTTWCWGGSVTPPVAPGDTLRFTALSVSGTYGCGLRPSQEVWCWQFSGSVPTAVKKVEGVSSLSLEHGIALGVRAGGVLIRWDAVTEGAWSTAPVTSLDAQRFSSLSPNTAYAVLDVAGAVYVGGEHYSTNNTGYYNDQYFPLQPVDE